MKIVIAVDEDKKTVVKRTGQAAFFAIYEDGKAIDFIENGHGHGGGTHHDHEHMEDEEHTHSHRKDVEGLSGCDLILVRAVGENMKEALESVGLKVKKIREKHGIMADEVIENFLNNKI